MTNAKSTISLSHQSEVQSVDTWYSVS